MNRRDFVKSVFGSTLLIGLNPVIAMGKKLVSKPNIVLIISDDAGYSDFGFNGGNQIPTPNLDWLAEKGVTCSQGYVTASVCCPSRMGLMTGRYQQRFGAECNVPTIPTPGFTKDDLGKEISEHTIGNGLQDAGYRTMLIGKWHLGEHPPYHPLKCGFDEFYGFLGGSRSYWPLKNPARGSAIMHNNETVDEEKQIKYTTDDFTDAAMEFIKKNKADPFFIYLSYNAVHTPMHAKEEDIEQFMEITPGKRRIYAAMTRSMDENVGRLRKTLKQHNLEDNTLIIFINDNGGATNNASVNKPLRGAKGTYWEGGIRVPFVIRWPGVLAEGIEYKNPVSTLDILPTLLAAAGGKHTGKKLDGVNILPYLKGRKNGKPHKYLFWRLWRVAAVRRDNWKLIRVAEDPLSENRKNLLEPMLFNIEKDIAETQNLAQRHPEITTELLTALENWEKQLAQPRWYDGINWQHWADEQVKNHKM
jgi:arylsulfatase A-like enzyme